MPIFRPRRPSVCVAAISKLLVLVLLFGASERVLCQAALAAGPVYRGMCDASAAVAINQRAFLVANDEDNTLRVYKRDEGGLPIAQFHFDRFLRSDPEHPEVDIEGAAKLGEVVYWIASHGRNKNGKKRPGRLRLFATSFGRQGDSLTVSGVGKPYTKLLDDLRADSRLDRYDLAKASTRAPKKKRALNIEGLAATPAGHLLIGFRNPIPDKKALIVPLLNPGEVITGSRAQLGAPMELDLDGLGIRSIDYHNGLKRYVIVAGSYKAGGKFAMYLWNGLADGKPERVRDADFTDLNPEAIVIYPDATEKDTIHVLSDDGTCLVGGKPCKELEDIQRRSFRSMRVQLRE